MVMSLGSVWPVGQGYSGDGHELVAFHALQGQEHAHHWAVCGLSLGHGQCFLVTTCSESPSWDTQGGLQSLSGFPCGGSG